MRRRYTHVFGGGMVADPKGQWVRYTEWRCDWTPDDLNPGPECPYCAGQMCARFDGVFGCDHDREERHGYANPKETA